MATGKTQGIVGQWLTGPGFGDASGGHNDGINHGVIQAPPGAAGEAWAAHFNGADSWIEVPDAPSLRLGQGDFSICVWLHTDAALKDVPGDILSKYDPAVGRGFHLSLLTLAGVTSSQPNQRNLHFGLDGGGSPPAWQEVGRPGRSVFTTCFAVFEGDLYCGTFETGPQEAGHVYRYDGRGRWADCGNLDQANAVTSLVVFGGSLYAASSHYRSSGSSLAESGNMNPGGLVYRYAGGREWVCCGKPTGPSVDKIVDPVYMSQFAGWRPGESDAIHCMAVYDGRLYVIPMYHQGLYLYEGGTQWRDCGTPGCRLMSLAVYNGYLYGAGNEGNKRGGVYRYDGDSTWTRTGEQPGVEQTYSFAIHEGSMYVGTWPEAAVFRYDGGTSWSHCGRLGEELEVMGMAPYNGRLYGGTLPLAQVYRYEGSGRWSCTGQLDRTPDVKYRRAWSMAVYDGKLFCGTLPSGRVFSLEAGQNVTLDRELAPGWQHIAAVRQGKTLRLYVGGKEVASATATAGSACDVSTSTPLRIGFGSNDYLCGRLRNVELYDRALNGSEVAERSRR